MTPLEAVATMIEGAGIVNVAFINFMPAEATSGVLIRDPFGGFPIDYELPGYKNTSFMLITRAPTEQGAKELMDACLSVLTVSSTTVEGIQINYMRPKTEPYTYSPSVAGKVEKLVNIDLCCVFL